MQWQLHEGQKQIQSKQACIAKAEGYYRDIFCTVVYFNLVTALKRYNSSKLTRKDFESHVLRHSRSLNYFLTNQMHICKDRHKNKSRRFDWIHSRNKQWLTSVETETLWASLSMSQHINSATGKKWVKQLFSVSWTSLYRNSIHSWLDQKLCVWCDYS